MCNRPIKIEDIEIMKGEAWDLKLIVLEGPITSGMTSGMSLYPVKKEKELKNKEV